MAVLVRTVRGDIDPASVGIALCHEHLAVDAREGFNNPEIILDNPDEVAEDLLEAKQHGLRTVVDVSTIGMKRDPRALLYIAERSGLNVVAPAGFYHGHFLPDYVGKLEVAEMVATIVKEVEEGIDDTGIRAGVIGEVGASVGQITEVERRLLLASGQAQKITSACVITHTDVGKMAMEQLDLLEEGGADPTRVLMGHMDCNPNLADQAAVAQRGAFVGFDRIGLDKYLPDSARVRAIVDLVEKGYAGRIILSNDLARYTRLLRHGGRGYGYVLREFVPSLREAGLDDATIHLILVENPRNLLAFTPRH
ncbi:MAG: phosphotriesterase family protein [Chloroflexota bacterium]